MTEKVYVVDFFSGCGGTSQGLQDSGMEIVAGIDSDPDAASTYRLNFPSAKFLERDVATIHANEIGGLLPSDGFILFAGCAPCQPFSAQRTSRKERDPRRLLLLEFLRFVEELRPDFVMVENVPGIQRPSDGDGPFAGFVQTLVANGYQTTYGILKAADFGVPQIRKRLVLLASRVSEVEMPNSTHGDGLLPFSTVSDWIRDLPSLSAGGVDASDPDHVSMKLQPINLERIRATPEGGGRESWPDHLKLDCHLGHSGHTDVYGRLAWDKPASGLTTKCISYSNGRFGHPIQDRALSVREAALLQTFPRSFKLFGSTVSKARQIGNAVPPLLARRVGDAIRASLEATSGE